MPFVEQQEAFDIVDVNYFYNDHGPGANVVFLDGHVTFLSQDINPVVLRFLSTAKEKVSPGSFGTSDY